MAFTSKSYRKFVASSAAVTLVASAVSPAVAASNFTDVSDRYKEAVNYLVKEEITEGMTETQFGTQLPIKRVDAAVMIARALKLDTSDAPDSGFTDVPSRAKEFVDALKAEGIVNGKTETSFASEANITRGEMALILDRAYELSGGNAEDLPFTDVGSRYTEAVADLVANDITRGKTETSFGTTASITRGEFALFLHRLAKDEDVKPLPEAPAVTGVSALNATQVTVQFNTEVNSDQRAGNAEDTGLYSLDNVEPVKAEMADDKKSVILTFEDSVEVEDGVVVVDPVVSAQKGEDGNWLQTEKFTSVFSYKDTVKPAVEDVSYANEKITVTFSEAIRTKPTVVRVNGESVSADDIAINSEDPTKVEINYTLEPSATASLYVAGAKDKAEAANEMNLFKGTVTAPAEDTNKPYVTSTEVTGQNTAKVTLSEEVQQSEINVKLQRGSNQTNATLVKDTEDASGQTYTLTVDLNGDQAGDGIFEGESVSETFTMYLDKGAMTDRSGLENEASQTELTFSKDTEAPKLVSSQVSADGQTFEFTFSEAIQVEGEDSVIDIRNAEGVKFNAIASETDVKADDPNTYQVDIKEGTEKIDPGSYKVVIPAEFFTDVYGNETVEARNTFTVGEELSEEDTVKPEVSSITGANTFTVTFSEKVTESAIDLANYELDGEALPDGTDIYFSNTQRNTVVIELPAGSVNIGDQQQGANAILSVSDVEDEAGNIMNAQNFTVTVKDNTPATITDVEELSGNVVVTFSEDVKIVGPNEAETVDANNVFDIKVGGTEVEAGNLQEVEGKLNQLKFTLTDAPAEDPTVVLKKGQRVVQDKNGVPVE